MQTVFLRSETVLSTLMFVLKSMQMLCNIHNDQTVLATLKRFPVQFETVSMCTFQ
jgi:hypothetical protein